MQATTIWRIDLVLDGAGRQASMAALSAEERDRASRFLRQEDRDRYAASHAALRRILAGALDADPADLRFRSGKAGKPELDGPWRDRLAFNLSHSGRVGLVGVTTGARIGIDVEFVRPIPDCLGLARSHFAREEVSALARLSQEARLAAFYACWTRKEAFVKALGLGLSFPLDRFVVAVPPAPCALLSIDGSPASAQGWTLQHLEPASGHVGAIAIEGPEQGCVLRSLEQDRLFARR